MCGKHSFSHTSMNFWVPCHLQSQHLLCCDVQKCFSPSESTSPSLLHGENLLVDSNATGCPFAAMFLQFYWSSIPWVFSLTHCQLIGSWFQYRAHLLNLSSFGKEFRDGIKTLIGVKWGCHLQMYSLHGTTWKWFLYLLSSCFYLKWTKVGNPYSGDRGNQEESAIGCWLVDTGYNRWHTLTQNVWWLYFSFLMCFVLFFLPLVKQAL